MLSIIPSLFEHLERQPRRSPWFAGQDKATVLQSLAASPKYVADERELRTSLARRWGLTADGVTERILKEMSDHTLVTRPPLEPTLVIDYRCDAEDGDSPLAKAADSFRFVALVSWHPGRQGGQDLSVLAYPGFRPAGETYHHMTPLWLGLDTNGVRTLNTQTLCPEVKEVLRDMIPVFCFGVALTLHVLATPGCSITAAQGPSIRIGTYTLDPATVYKPEIGGA